MRKHSNRIVLGLLSAVLIIGAAAPTASAATAAPVIPATAQKLPASCDVVRNRIDVTLSRSGSQANAGSSFKFSGVAKNGNPYPVPDAAIVARIIKLPKDLGSSYDKALDIVQRTVVADHLYLKPGEEKNFPFEWQIPSQMLAGSYRIDFFVMSSGQFPAGGNEYLGIPAASYPVRVASAAKDVSFFDLPSILVNGVGPYPTGIVDLKTADALVSVSALNTYAEPHDASVVWSVYKSNFANPADLVATKTDAVQFQPGKRTVLSYEFDTGTHSGYLVVGKLVDGKKSSLFSVRLNRQDIMEPYVRSLVLDTFPLKEGERATIFGCVADNAKVPSSSEVRVSLVDTDGRSLYSGSFTKTQKVDPLEFIGDFVPQGSIAAPLTLRLEAFLPDGSQAGSSTVTYSCAGSACSSGLFSGVRAIYASVAVLILLAIAAVSMRKGRREGMPNAHNQ